MGLVDRRSDSELLVDARLDPEAFGEFYRRHAQGLLVFFRRRVANAELAFDLTAETMAAALEAVPRYEPRPEPARAWLYGIARHKLAEARRAGQVENRARIALAMQPIALDDSGIGRLESLSSAPALELMTALPPEQQAAIRARHLEDRDYPDIAHTLGISESVIRKRVSRGLHTMRARLKEDTNG